MLESFIVNMLSYLRVPFREIREGSDVIRHYLLPDGKVVEEIREA